MKTTLKQLAAALTFSVSRLSSAICIVAVIFPTLKARASWPWFSGYINANNSYRTYAYTDWDTPLFGGGIQPDSNCLGVSPPNYKVDGHVVFEADGAGFCKIIEATGSCSQWLGQVYPVSIQFSQWFSNPSAPPASDTRHDWDPNFLNVLSELIPPPATPFYDPAPDFSATNDNPNSVWSYGWMPTDFSSFNFYTNHVTGANGPQWYGWNGDWTPCIWKNLGNPVSGVPTGWLCLHPGPGTEPSVLRWTAPFSGTVKVIGQFLPGDSGSMQVAIRLAGKPWWSATDSGNFSLNTNLVAGTTIDFAVFGGYGFGSTPLSVIISKTPALLLTLERTGQTNTLSFIAPMNGLFVLQFRDNLSPTSQWSNLTTNSLSANQLFHYMNTSTNPAGYYRAQYY
jgi:hypothetical protein